MNKIPTAEEMERSGKYDDYSSMMRAFARMHVKAALEAAKNEVRLKRITGWGTLEYPGPSDIDYINEVSYNTSGHGDSTFTKITVNTSDIIYAYPEKNII